MIGALQDPLTPALNTTLSTLARQAVVFSDATRCCPTQHYSQGNPIIEVIERTSQAQELS